MWPRTFALVGLLVVSMVALGAPGAQAADSPEISVSVNGDAVENDARIVVPEANLSTAVRADEPIETVVVRINGEDVLESSPGTRGFDTTLESADLEARWNTVQVIATTADGTLQSHRFHLYKDTLAPDIGLSSPVTVESGHRFHDRIERTEAELTVNGTVSDASDIQDFEARIAGGGRSVTTENLTNGSFRIDTTLGLGNHTLRIEATDEYGNHERASTRIRVTDDGEPSVRLRNLPNRTTADRIEPTVEATDAIAVRSIEVGVSGQPSRTVLEPATQLLGTDRTNVSRTVPIEFYHSGNHTVTVNVSDYAGEFAEISRTVTYDPETPAERVAPEIVVDENRSGMLGESTYRLQAAVMNGSVRKVVVEAAKNETGVPTAYERVYEGAPRARVEINHSLTVEPGRNDIQIEVEDARNRTHTETITIDTETAPSIRPDPTSTNGTTDAPETTRKRTTVGSTRISVTEMPPLTPGSGGSVPTSPLLVPLAVVVVAVLALWRR